MPKRGRYKHSSRNLCHKKDSLSRFRRLPLKAVTSSQTPIHLEIQQSNASSDKVVEEISGGRLQIALALVGIIGGAGFMLIDGSVEQYKKALGGYDDAVVPAGFSEQELPFLNKVRSLCIDGEFLNQELEGRVGIVEGAGTAEIREIIHKLIQQEYISRDGNDKYICEESF